MRAPQPVEGTSFYVRRLPGSAFKHFPESSEDEAAMGLFLALHCGCDAEGKPLWPNEDAMLREDMADLMLLAQAAAAANADLEEMTAQAAEADQGLADVALGNSPAHPGNLRRTG